MNMSTMSSEPTEKLPGMKWVLLQHRQQPQLPDISKSHCLLEEAVIAAQSCLSLHTCTVLPTPTVRDH